MIEPVREGNKQVGRDTDEPERLVRQSIFILLCRKNRFDMSNFPWGHSKRYNDFSTYFRAKMGGRVQKVSVDAGFTCPNRDGSRGTGGCIYCNNKTFKPTYCNLQNSVAKQVGEGIEFFARKYEAMKYLAYFQAYTNTYAPLENLKALYEEALQHPKIIGLVLATRPDCVSDEILDYLQELSERVYVMVEYGLESHKNETLNLINRGHTFDESVRAIEATANRNIHTGAHLILGLPGETYPDFLDQARVISQLPVENLKLHQLQIHRDTRLYHDYKLHPEKYKLFEIDEYVNLVVDYLELLNPRIIVERFVSESPAGMLVAPNWGIKNFEFVARVERRLKERNTWQGRLFQ